MVFSVACTTAYTCHTRSKFAAFTRFLHLTTNSILPFVRKTHTHTKTKWYEGTNRRGGKDAGKKNHHKGKITQINPSTHIPLCFIYKNRRDLNHSSRRHSRNRRNDFHRPSTPHIATSRNRIVLTFHDAEPKPRHMSSKRRNRMSSRFRAPAHE